MIESIMKLHKCDHCPIRCQASRRPRSFFARIHRWHATWWPGWKLYQAELGARRAKAVPQVRDRVELSEGISAGGLE